MMRSVIVAVLVAAGVLLFAGCTAVGGGSAEVEHYGYTGSTPGKCTSCE